MTDVVDGLRPGFVFPCHCEERSDVGRKGAPPVAESSDRSGWAGTCLCTNEVQGKGLVPTQILTPCTQKVNCPERAREAGLGHSPLLSHQTLFRSFSAVCRDVSHE